MSTRVRSVGIAAAIGLAGFMAAMQLVAVALDSPPLRWGPGHGPGIRPEDAPLTQLGDDRLERGLGAARTVIPAGAPYAVRVGPHFDGEAIPAVLLYYLYPAIAVPSLSDADYVIVVGRGQRPAAFSELRLSGDVWVGERRR